jgi:hypothetical protein
MVKKSEAHQIAVTFARHQHVSRESILNGKPGSIKIQGSISKAFDNFVKQTDSVSQEGLNLLHSAATRLNKTGRVSLQHADEVKRMISSHQLPAS